MKTNRIGRISLCAMAGLAIGFGAACETGLEKGACVLIDNAEETLILPEGAGMPPDFAIAQDPPVLRFAIVQGCSDFPKNNKGNWSSWGQSICASDGNFYTSISDHRGVDGQCFIVRVDPATGEQTQVFNSNKLFNHQPGAYGHGKLHGRLDEYPEGRLIAATYWGIPPMDTTYQGEFWTGPIPGGRIVAIDLSTGTSTDWGEPFARDSWPMFATDTRRGVFFAIGYDKHFLAYDLDGRKSVYVGLPPANVEWFPRCTLVDEKTGACYGTSRGRFVKYDPTTNAFAHLAISAPDNANKKEKDASLRAHTRRRTKDGCYVCVTFDGMLFKFFPDTEEVKTIGVNWAEGLYTTALALSPDDRYVYYTVAAHGTAYEYGAPLVQYDLDKGTFKVIAFLQPLLQKHFGYRLGGSYAISLDAEGARLCITWNGQFIEGEEDKQSFGDPTLLLVDIPASER